MSCIFILAFIQRLLKFLQRNLISNLNNLSFYHFYLEYFHKSLYNFGHDKLTCPCSKDINSLFLEGGGGQTFCKFIIAIKIFLLILANLVAFIWIFNLMLVKIKLYTIYLGDLQFLPR